MQVAAPRFDRRGVSRVGRLAAIFFIVAATVAAGYVIYQRVNPPAVPLPPQTVPVTRGNILASITATGNVAATQSSRLTFLSDGTVESVNVQVGDQVTNGEVLATLDTTQLQTAVETAQAQLASAQALLDQELAGPRPEDVTIAQEGLTSAIATLDGLQVSRPEDIDAAQAALEAAQAKLAQMEEGSRPEQIESAQAGLNSAAASLQQIQSPLQSDVIAAQTALNNARDTAASAHAALNDVTISYPAALSSAQSSVQSAQSDLATAQSHLSDLLNPRAENVASAQSAVQSAQADLQSAAAKQLSDNNGGTAVELLNAQSAYQQAQSNLTAAQAAFQQAQAGPNASDLATAQAAVSQAQSDYLTAKSRYDTDLAAGSTLAQQQADANAVTAAEQTVQSAQAKLQTLQAGTVASDLANAQSAVDIAQSQFTASRRTLEEMRTSVGAGQQSDQAAVQQAQSTLSSAQSTLENLVTPLATDVEAAQEAVTAGQASYDAAVLNLQQIANGPKDVTVVQAQTAADAADASVVSAQAALDQLLNPQGSTLEAAQSALTSAQDTLTLTVYPFTDADMEAQRQAVVQAQTNLLEKLVPSTDTQIAAQQAAVRSAMANLSEKQTPYLPSDIASARSAVQQAQSGLETAQKNFDGGQIVAPYDGQVGVVNVAVDENSVDGVTGGGTTGAAGGSGITIIDPASLQVYAQVDETDIANVAVGQTANVTFDGLPGKRFTGKVISVDPVSTTTQGVVGYQVAIQLDNTNGVNQGMTATAQIVTSERDGVLMVPNRALSAVQGQTAAAAQGASGASGGQTGQNRPAGAAGQGGAGQGAAGQARAQQASQRQVQVQTPDGIQTKIVQVGLANDTNTEIVSGLDEGNVLVLPTTVARAGLPGTRPGAVTGGLPLGGAAPAARPGGF